MYVSVSLLIYLTKTGCKGRNYFNNAKKILKKNISGKGFSKKSPAFFLLMLKLQRNFSYLSLIVYKKTHILIDTNSNKSVKVIDNEISENFKESFIKKL